MNQLNDITIGKIEDAGQLVKGGRIDRYWQEEGVNLNPKYYVGSSQVLKAKWLHDSQQAVEHFNLRSIEFGNWMNQDDRANFLYATMLSLHHLALLFRIDDFEIGLGKRLSIALGARGKGKAAGHYEPNPYAVINITKTQGVGVLAHEFGHALDNVISFYTKSKQIYVSGGRTTRKGFDEDLAKKGNWFEQQFEEFFNILYYDVEGNKTEFHQALHGYDDYWNFRNEVFARTFEVYIADKLKKKGFKNHFLVLGASGDAYPSLELVGNVTRIIENIAAHAFKLFRESSPLNGVNVGVSGYIGFRKTIKEDANLDDTLERMKIIAQRDAYQVKELAENLQGNTVYQTSENIWNWLRANTRYKLDTNGIEELRTPARSIVDGKAGMSDPEFGIDCDDYTILVSAILINLGIGHEYRVAAYERKGKFQHIYPVAFDENGNEYIIDAVPEIPFFNYEAEPIIDLKTVKMELQELSGLGSTDEEIATEFQLDLKEALNEEFTLSGIDNDEDDDFFNSQFLSGLVEVDSREKADIVLNGSDVPNILRNGVLAEISKARQMLLKEKQNPSILSQTINVDEEYVIMNDLIESWSDEDERIEVLEDAIENGGAYKNFYTAILLSLQELEKEEEEIGLSGLEYDEIFLAKVDPQTIDLSDLLASDQLGFFKKLWGKVKSAAKSIVSKVKTITKKVIKAVVKYNPVSLVLKGATLSILKLNMFSFAEKLFYGYISEGHAKKNNINMAQWRKAVASRKKLEGWYGKIGSKSAFKNAVVKGRARKQVKIGLGQLGVVATGTLALGGSAFIILAKQVLDGLDLKNMFSGKNSGGGLSPSTTAPGTPSTIPNSVAFEGDDGSSAFNGDDGSSAFESQSRMASNYQSNGQSARETVAPPPIGFMQKVKDFLTKHKKKIIIGGIGVVVATIVGLVIWKKIKDKKKRSLAGVKAARTRAKNRTNYTALKGASSSKSLGKGSTTILRIPTKSVNKARISKRSNADRLRAMHKKAQELQKKHPNNKYSNLLKKASKLI